MLKVLTRQEFRRAAAILKKSSRRLDEDRLNAAEKVLVDGVSYQEAADEIGLFTAQVRVVTERVLACLYPPTWQPVTVTLLPQDMAKLLAMRDEMLAAD